MLTGRQIRDARFRAGLELEELAIRSGMGRDRLAYAEAMYGAPAWSGAEFDRVRSALEAVGVEFIPEDGGSAGVRMRKAES